MLSILIPTYNYNVYPLAKELHKQFSKQGIPFEIRIYDDSSTINFENNELINELSNITYKKFKENKGRTYVRHLLALDAKYKHLLFLDADVFPKDRFYASKWIKELEKTSADVYFGGIQLPPQAPSPQKTLRWKYGKEREAVPVEVRIKHPYRSLISGAMLIDKNVFLKVSDSLKNINRYGLDIYFSYLLKQQKAKVRHFNNPIMHLGLEENEVFIRKSKKAVETLFYLIKNKMIPEDYSRLGKTVSKIKKTGCKFLKHLFSLQNLCLKNLLSRNPSLKIFDLFKLCYFCKIST